MPSYAINQRIGSPTTIITSKGAISADYIGGGTVAPSEALHIVGNVRFSGALMPNNLPGTSGYIFISQGAGVAPIWSSPTSLPASDNAWKILGNSGTTAGTNFVGTTDGQDVVFKRNSAEGMRLNSLNYLSVINSITLPTTTSATLGILFKGTDRFLHNYTLTGTSGFNTFLGINSGNFAMSGSGGNASFNTGLGHSTLTAITTGQQNTTVGYAAGNGNTSGSNNTGIGHLALTINTQGWYNTAVGSESLPVLNGTMAGAGYRNSCFGYRSGYAVTTGGSNTLIGSSAGFYITTGQTNTIIGANSGGDITTGHFNTIIGANVTGLAAGLSNTVIIADGQGNQRIYVNSLGHTGIGTILPGTILDVLGTQGTITSTINQKGVLSVQDSTATAINVGAAITLGGLYQSGSYGNFAAIKGSKEDATSGNANGIISLYTSTSSGLLTERLKISSTGVVTIPNLAGTGSRNVVVDANGVLSAP